MGTRRAIVHITDVMGVTSSSISLYVSPDMGDGADDHRFSCAATTHTDDGVSDQEWIRDALVNLIEHL